MAGNRHHTPFPVITMCTHFFHLHILCINYLKFHLLQIFLFQTISPCDVCFKIGGRRTIPTSVLEAGSQRSLQLLLLAQSCRVCVIVPGHVFLEPWPSLWVIILKSSVAYGHSEVTEQCHGLFFSYVLFCKQRPCNSCHYSEYSNHPQDMKRRQVENSCRGGQ